MNILFIVKEIFSSSLRGHIIPPNNNNVDIEPRKTIIFQSLLDACPLFVSILESHTEPLKISNQIRHT